MACKWSFARKVNLSGNLNLQKLVQFYVWETPVPGTSEKGTSFRELGWSKGGYKTLHSLMRCVSGFPNCKWIGVPAKDIEATLGDLNRLNSFDGSFEFAVHTIKSGLNKTEALFYSRL